MISLECNAGKHKAIKQLLNSHTTDQTHLPERSKSRCVLAVMPNQRAPDSDGAEQGSRVRNTWKTKCNN